MKFLLLIFLKQFFTDFISFQSEHSLRLPTALVVVNDENVIKLWKGC